MHERCRGLVNLEDIIFIFNLQGLKSTNYEGEDNNLLYQVVTELRELRAEVKALTLKIPGCSINTLSVPPKDIETMPAETQKQKPQNENKQDEKQYEGKQELKSEVMLKFGALSSMSADTNELLDHPDFTCEIKEEILIEKEREKYRNNNLHGYNDFERSVAQDSEENQIVNYRKFVSEINELDGASLFLMLEKRRLNYKLAKLLLINLVDSAQESNLAVSKYPFSIHVGDKRFIECKKLVSNLLLRNPQRTSLCRLRIRIAIYKARYHNNEQSLTKLIDRYPPSGNYNSKFQNALGSLYLERAMLRGKKGKKDLQSAIIYFKKCPVRRALAFWNFSLVCPESELFEDALCLIPLMQRSSLLRKEANKTISEEKKELIAGAATIFWNFYLYAAEQHKNFSLAEELKQFPESSLFAAELKTLEHLTPLNPTPYVTCSRTDPYFLPSQFEKISSHD